MEPQRTAVAPAPGESLTQDQVRERLQEVALFEGLDGADLEQILSISESVLVEAGEHLFDEGERGDHFYIIVRGEVELRKSGSEGSKRLAVLRAGQAFGEMALLNQTPRSASAVALEDTYMLSVSRAAFGEILGGDSLAVRLLRNLSRALWATSVRLANRQAQLTRSDTSHEALADFNRLLRARLLPRVTPRVSGYDLAASTLGPRQGTGSSVWDWVLLADGRPAFVVMRATRADVFSAHRLSALRNVLRAEAADPHPTLAGRLSRINRGFRAGWVEGLSGPVACVLAALADGAVEWAIAGDPCGLIVRAGGATHELPVGAPALGERPEYEYRSTAVPLGSRDKVVLLSEPRDRAAALVTSVVSEGYTSSSRDALNKIFARLASAPGAGSTSDLTGAVITRTA